MDPSNGSHSRGRQAVGLRNIIIDSAVANRIEISEHSSEYDKSCSQINSSLMLLERSRLSLDPEDQSFELNGSIDVSFDNPGSLKKTFKSSKSANSKKKQFKLSNLTFGDNNKGVELLDPRLIGQLPTPAKIEIVSEMIL